MRCSEPRHRAQLGSLDRNDSPQQVFGTYMKKSLAAMMVAALLACGCATSRNGNWNYKVIEAYPDRLEQQLSTLSQEGWIVVSSSATKDANEKPKVVVILKRSPNKK